MKKYPLNSEYPDYELGVDIEMDRKVYLSLWWGFLLNAMVLLIGIPFLPEALRCFRLKDVKPKGRASTWDWRVTLMIVLLVAAYGEWFYYLSYLIPDFLWNLFPMFFEILFDGAWRCIPVVALVLIWGVRWRHFFRVLDLDKAPHFKVILGMMSVAQIFNLILYYLFEHFDQISWGTTRSIEDGLGGFMLAITSGVILAPIVEEIEFRGFLFRSLHNYFPWKLAMVVSTAFFVSIHYYDLYGSIGVSPMRVGQVIRRHFL